MAEYIDREKLIPDRCYYEPDGYEAVSCEQIFHEDVADVIEREKIEKAIKEIKEKENTQEHIFYDGDIYIRGAYNDGMEKALKILKKYIGE